MSGPSWDTPRYDGPNPCTQCQGLRWARESCGKYEYRDKVWCSTCEGTGKSVPENGCLPRFTLDGYEELLCLLRESYTLHPTTAIPHEEGRCVFLRHDVDLHLEGALEVAAVEESMGVRSTWYVGTRLAYNPAFEPNAAVIRELAKRGHGIGLHYVAGQELMPDMQTLEAIQGGQPITQTWVMHEPSAGGEDRHMNDSGFATGNPHAHGLHYVSDSGMRWHEPWIGSLLAGEPDRVMLNTHHEHWVGEGTRRARADCIRVAAMKPQRTYLDHLLKGYANPST